MIGGEGGCCGGGVGGGKCCGLMGESDDGCEEVGENRWMGGGEGCWGMLDAGGEGCGIAGSSGKRRGEIRDFEELDRVVSLDSSKRFGNSRRLANFERFAVGSSVESESRSRLESSASFFRLKPSELSFSSLSFALFLSLLLSSQSPVGKSFIFIALFSLAPFFGTSLGTHPPKFSSSVLEASSSPCETLVSSSFLDI